MCCDETKAWVAMVAMVASHEENHEDFILQFSLNLSKSYLPNIIDNDCLHIVAPLCRLSYYVIATKKI